MSTRAHSCRRVSELSSKRLDAPLSWGERFAVRVHLLYCTGCRRFAAQVEDLRRLAKRLG